jgi:hypothetical protein
MLRRTSERLASNGIFFPCMESFVPKTVKVNAVVVLTVAALFFELFIFPKHDAALSKIAITDAVSKAEEILKEVRGWLVGSAALAVFTTLVVKRT